MFWGTDLTASVGDHGGNGVVCHALLYGLKGVCIPDREVIRDAGGKERLCRNGVAVRPMESFAQRNNG